MVSGMTKMAAFEEKWICRLL